MLTTYPDIEIVNMDVLTYAGNLENLSAFEDDERHSLERKNIASEEDVESVFRAHEIDIVVNFAAESHVDRSLHIGAEAFIRTNVMGVQVLLDAARVHGVQRFVQISTDEVYGSLGPEGRFTELTPLAPNNPYAATKAGADLLVRAAHKSHGIDVVITRCSNNFGPYQFPEKLIPLMIANALEKKPLPVYGDGLNVRDWIYVQDHCRAIDDVMRGGRSGEVYNIGSDHDVPNLEIVTQILALVDRPESLIQFVEDRPGHDRRYAMDSSKIRDELGWTPELGFEDALEATVQWYLENDTWLEHVRSGAYQGYYEMLYGERPRVPGR
jgi:dTDP-glucose 4,6-dehydratase